MTSSELDNLVRIGKLKREPHSTRERRNLAEYEGYLERDDRLLVDVIATAERLRETVEALPPSTAG